MTEKDIIHENGQFWVLKTGGAYRVMKTGANYSVEDSAYKLNADGKSLAISRCDYLEKRRLATTAISKY